MKIAVATSAAAAAALLLTGCSSSGSRSAPLTLTDVPLVAADLPSTWKAMPHDTSGDSDSDASEKKIVTCVGGGARDTTAERIKEIHSKDYSSGDSQITSSASTYKTDAAVKSDVALFANPRTESCYTALAKSEFLDDLPAGSKVGAVHVNLAKGSNGGPSNVVATVQADITLTVQGQTVTLYIDSAFITGNKIQAEVDFDGFGKRIDEDTRTKAIKAVADRAAKT